MHIYTKFLLTIIAAVFTACNALNTLPPNQILEVVCGVNHTFYSTNDPECNYYQDCDIYDEVYALNRSGYYIREDINVIDADGNILYNVLRRFSIGPNNTNSERIYIDAGSFISIYVEQKDQFVGSDWVPCNTKSYYLGKSATYSDATSETTEKWVKEQSLPMGRDLGFTNEEVRNSFILYLP